MPSRTSLMLRSARKGASRSTHAADAALTAILAQPQPDFQYFINPLESAADLRGPLRRAGNEAILGLRTRITL